MACILRNDKVKSIDVVIGKELKFQQGISWGDFYSLSKQTTSETVTHKAVIEKVVSDLSMESNVTPIDTQEFSETKSVEEEIIDTFIKNEPRISKLPVQEAEEGSEHLVDLGEKSSQLHAFPFTETYAKLS